MFILLKSHHLGRLSSSLEHLVLMALRHLLTPQTSFCFWPRIYTGSQRGSSTVCVNADVMKTTCAFSKETPSCSIWCFFQQNCFHCTKEPKVKKQEKQHHLGLEGKTADWSCDLACQGKNVRLVTTHLETLPEKKSQVPLFQWAFIQRSAHILCFYLNIWLYTCKTIFDSVTKWAILLFYCFF